MTIRLDTSRIGEVLRQHGPMLMLDRLEIAADFSSASGVKCVSMGHPCFQGHFPSAPILPGVVQIGAVCQAAGGLLKACDDCFDAPLVPVLREVRKFKFRKPVTPGDVLEVVVERDEQTPQLFHGLTRVNGDVASQGHVVVELQSPEGGDAQSARPLLEPLPELAGIGEKMESVMNAEEIMQAIPHRFPFLLIDRVLLRDTESLRFVALKNVSRTDAYFDGVQQDFLPRFLLAEMGAQAGCGMALTTPGQKDMLVYFMAIDKAVHHEHVFPGDRLLIDIQIAVRSRFGKADGTVYVGNRAVAELGLKFAMVERLQSA